MPVAKYACSNAALAGNDIEEQEFDLLAKHKKVLKDIAEALLEKEVLGSEEIEAFLNGKGPKKAKTSSSQKKIKKKESTAKNKQKAAN